VAPLLGPKIAPLTQPVPLQPLQQPSIVPPSPPIVPPSTPVNPALARPRAGRDGADSRSAEAARRRDRTSAEGSRAAAALKKPEEKKPAQTKPVPQKQTQKTNPKQKSQQAQLPVAPAPGRWRRPIP
jgi:hypothetical protein